MPGKHNRVWSPQLDGSQETRTAGDREGHIRKRRGGVERRRRRVKQGVGRETYWLLHPQKLQKASPSSRSSLQNLLDLPHNTPHPTDSVHSLMLAYKPGVGNCVPYPTRHPPPELQGHRGPDQQQRVRGVSP